MRTCILIVLALLNLPQIVRAEKILIYDEERGILSIDKEEYERLQKAKQTTTQAREQDPTPAKGEKKRSPNDIHIGREKDPPELYFKSGLQYFNNNDFKNALKNFEFVVQKVKKPEYLLWLGKTHRNMGDDTMMLSLMKKIVDRYPDSDVADDALFEIAFFHQRQLEYGDAADAYARLAEQYPFGLSYSNGHEFLEISRNQRKNMRAEMITTLNYLGYDIQSLDDALIRFQQNNGLEVSGKADAPTVKAMKELHSARLEAEALVDRNRKKLQTTVKWGSVAGVILLINLVAVFLARMRIRRTRKQLQSLQALLLELDTSAL